MAVEAKVAVVVVKARVAQKVQVKVWVLVEATLGIVVPDRSQHSL